MYFYKQGPQGERLEYFGNRVSTAHFASPEPVTNQCLGFSVYSLWPTRKETWLEFCMSWIYPNTFEPSHTFISAPPGDCCQLDSGWFTWLKLLRMTSWIALGVIMPKHWRRMTHCASWVFSLRATWRQKVAPGNWRLGKGACQMWHAVESQENVRWDRRLYEEPVSDAKYLWSLPLH